MVFGLCLDRLDFNVWAISKFTFSRRADLFFWGIWLSGMLPLYSCFMLNSLNIKMVVYGNVALDYNQRVGVILSTNPTDACFVRSNIHLISWDSCCVIYNFNLIAGRPLVPRTFEIQSQDSKEKWVMMMFDKTCFSKIENAFFTVKKVCCTLACSYKCLCSRVWKQMVVEKFPGI